MLVCSPWETRTANVHMQVSHSLSVVVPSFVPSTDSILLEQKENRSKNDNVQTDRNVIIREVQRLNFTEKFIRTPFPSCSIIG